MQQLFLGVLWSLPQFCDFPIGGLRASLVVLWLKLSPSTIPGSTILILWLAQLLSCNLLAFLPPCFFNLVLVRLTLSMKKKNEFFSDRSGIFRVRNSFTQSRILPVCLISSSIHEFPHSTIKLSISLVFLLLHNAQSPFTSSACSWRVFNCPSM